MMGAAESISDLRSLLSIVAEETGALKMDDADEDSVGWTTEGPLPMTFGHVRRAHAALAALEAALSAAEPVAWLAARKWEQMTAAEPWLTNVVYSEDQAEFFPCVPLYAAPSAPSVAVKALEWAIDENHSQLQRSDFYTIESEFRQGFALHTAGKMGVFWFPTEREAKAAAQADYEARIRSALSAQVQDVAEVSPGDYMRRHDAAIAAYEANTPNDYRYSALGLRKAVDAAFAVAAAPAKQDGETYEERLLDRCRFESGSLTEARWTVPALAASKPAGDARFEEKAPSKQEGGHVTSK